MEEFFCHREKTLFFYYTTAGQFHYGIDGIKEDSFNIPPNREHLWAIIDVHGKCSAIELLDRQANLQLLSSISNVATTKSSGQLLSALSVAKIVSEHVTVRNVIHQI